MIRAAVTLDAAMTVHEALLRLAKHGYWLDPNASEASQWLDEYVAGIQSLAKNSKPNVERSRTSAASFERIDPVTMTRDVAARVLARPLDQGRVVIRRQDGVTIFWYARPMSYALPELDRANRSASVVDALGLHEYTSSPSEQVVAMTQFEAQRFDGVVLNGLQVFGVGEKTPIAEIVGIDIGTAGSGERGDRGGAPVDRSGAPMAGSSVPTPAQPAPGTDSSLRTELRSYPYLDAPTRVAVGQRFAVEIGLSDSAVAGVSSAGPMGIPVSAGAKTVEVDVQVVADGFAAVTGWKRTLLVDVSVPARARVAIELIAQPQQESVRVTALVVHYSVAGATCGIAFRHMTVGRTLGDVPPPDNRGQSWLDLEPRPAAVTLVAGNGVDVELDILKPDGNVAKGDYRCVFRNAHGVAVPETAAEIHLGDDAETFAKKLIDNMRLWGGDAMSDNAVEYFGRTAAGKLPDAFWSMLVEVSGRVGGRPLTLQLNSAEPYVPWELAMLPTPLDATRPPFLGAQVNMGRWILGDPDIASPPKRSVSVKAMAVMAGMYNATTGLRPLPMAQQEAQDLATTYADLPAVPLDCTSLNLKSLLDGTLTMGLKQIGGVQLVHFAGHGEVDPTRPGDAALFLSNGRPMDPMFLRYAKVGKQHEPFIFLNACMVGVGGQMLGDAGGFPGNCLAGGFSGLVAPLWAVNDTVARSVAIDFYQALLAAGSQRTVAELMRDLRGQYNSNAPVSSYLAYVFYGNPNLKVARA